MKRRQDGFVTLTVTLMLMVLGGYGLYKSVEASQYNVKRFQNVLSAKKNHWAAEGGLACAFGVNQTTVGDPTTRSYSACNNLVLGGSGDESRLSLTVTGQNVSGGLYTLKSTSSESHGPGSREVAKDIKVETVSAMPGIFKTSSNITLRGDFNLLPNYNHGECITMVLKSKSNFFHTDTQDVSDVIVQDGDGYTAEQLPEGVSVDDINTSANLENSKICNSGYQTYAKVGTEWPVAKDIIEDPNMDMFQDLFGKPKREWEKVRDEQGFTVIRGSDNDVFVADCAEQINSAFDKGDRSFWVEGSCNLDSPSKGIGTKPFDFTATSSVPMPDTESSLIVVQDGAVYASGTLGFSGLLYQFNTGNKSNVQIEAELFKACEAKGLCNTDDHKKPYANSAFYISGSLYGFGGIAVDMEGMNFIINGAFIAKYNDKYWKDILPNPTNTKVTWKQGTWRDFQ